VGGIIGFIIGIFLAQIIGLSVFNTYINPHIEVIPIAILISVAVAIFASIIPVRRAVKVEPALVLRGE
jgi:putative ABC transport system permease protein